MNYGTILEYTYCYQLNITLCQLIISKVCINNITPFAAHKVTIGNTIHLNKNISDKDVSYCLTYKNSNT